MPIRVEFTDAAAEDLRSYAQSGNLLAFIAKLVRLEEHGLATAQPLGRGLHGWYKIVVGDRDWRIVVNTDAEDSVATVWVIGDRSDEACYEQALDRIQSSAGGDPVGQTLAAVMMGLMRDDK